MQDFESAIQVRIKRVAAILEYLESDHGTFVVKEAIKLRIINQRGKEE